MHPFHTPPHSQMSWILSSSLAPVDAYRPSPSSQGGSFSSPKVTITGTTWRDADNLRNRPKKHKGPTTGRTDADSFRQQQQQQEQVRHRNSSIDAATAAGIVAVSAAMGPSAMSDSIAGKSSHPSSPASTAGKDATPTTNTTP
jgi:hypothetical protein